MTPPPKPDAGMILWAWETLVPPGGVAELRCLGTRQRIVSGYFNDGAALVKAALHWNGQAEGVYVTLNPVNPALLGRAMNEVKPFAEKTTADVDVTGRLWLLIDCDPRRPAGISATEAEHQAGLSLAQEVWAFLTDLGWPEPIWADSGNGGHLLYRVLLPNSPEALLLASRCLQALALRFDDERVAVDVGNANASRVVKLYGTVARKGSHLVGPGVGEERPHRLSAVLSAPEAVEVVSAEHLAALAARTPQPPPAPAGRGSGQPLDVAGWIGSRGLAVSREGGYQGGRKWELAVCPWDASHTDRSAFIIQFPSGAVAAGCHHNSCQGRGWAELRALLEPAVGRRAPERPPLPEPPPAAARGREVVSGNGARTTAAKESGSVFPTGFTAADLQSIILPPPTWILQDLLTEGLGLLVGKPKLGKSWLALQIAVAVATGGVALGKIPVTERGVLYLALEDTKRRLQSRMYTLLPDSPWPPDLHLFTEWPSLQEGGRVLLAEWLDGHPSVRLIFIDTLGRLRGVRGRNTDAFQEDYAELGPLQSVAGKRGVSIVTIHHVRKMLADDPLDTISGTQGIPAAADTILILRRIRNQSTADLFVTGRDVEERTLALQWDPHTIWMLMGDAAEFHQTKEQQEVLSALSRGPLRYQALVSAVAEAGNAAEPAVKKRIGRMADRGLIRRDAGLYWLPETAENTPETGKPLPPVTPVTLSPFAVSQAQNQAPGEVTPEVTSSLGVSPSNSYNQDGVTGVTQVTRGTEVTPKTQVTQVTGVTPGDRGDTGDTKSAIPAEEREKGVL